MSDPTRTGPAVWVAGVDADGAEVARARLGHGDDPAVLLGRLGFAVVGARNVVAQTNPHEVTLVFAVSRGEVTEPVTEAAPHDADLVVRSGEQAVVVQRIGVYGVVADARGYLLTENSARTNTAGTWALPGGGLDPGELPEDALHREIWEETGQRVRIEGLAAVTTRHWVGRAPDGGLEDFHAVRLFYRAVCDDPSDPVVHDVDGTTAAAGWFTLAELGGLPLAPGTRDALRRLVAVDGRL